MCEKNNFFVFLLFIFFGLTYNCQLDKVKKIESYYYPIEELKEGLVYEYRSVKDDSIAPFYWYHITSQKDDSTYLASNYYDHDFSNTQLSIEQILSDGVILKDYYWFDKLPNGKAIRQKATIRNKNIFPFNVNISKKGFLISELSFKAPSDSLLTTNLVRNRQYVQDTIFTYQGKSYDCVLFFVKELIEYDHKEDGFREYEASMIEFYARGIGLVYFQKKVEEEILLEYRLVDRFPMKKLEEIAREKVLK